MSKQLLGYRLVLHDSELKSRVRFDLLPTDVQPTEMALTTVIPLPHGNVHIDREGLGVGVLGLSGTFGRETQSVGGKLWTGAERFFDFKRRFWRRYQELARHPEPLIAKNLKAVLYCWEEEEQWWVEPIRFDTPRSDNNKTFFEYDIEFRLLRPLKALEHTKTQRSLGGDVFSTYRGRIDTANQYLNALKFANELLRSNGELARGLSNTVSETLNRFVFSQIEDLQQSLESFVTGVSSVLHIPAKSLLDMAETIANSLEDTNTLVNAELTKAANDLRRLRKVLLRIANTDELFNQSVSESLSQIKEQVDGIESDHFASTSSSLSYQGQRPIRVKKGDTLPKLAAREMRSATQWESIALLNGLRYPYFSDTGTPGTLKPGETIWIPTESGSGSSSPTQPGSLSPEDKLYGRDLLVKQRGQTFSVVFENGDLVTVSGRANLTQAITMVTTIEEGHLLEDSTYGLKRPSGKLTQADLEELKTSIERVAQRDDRVSSVEAKVEAKANKTEASIKVFPIGGSQSPLNNLVEIPR